MKTRLLLAHISGFSLAFAITRNSTVGALYWAAIFLLTSILAIRRMK